MDEDDLFALLGGGGAHGEPDSSGGQEGEASSPGLPVKNIEMPSSDKSIIECTDSHTEPQGRSSFRVKSCLEPLTLEPAVSRREESR